MRRVVEFLSLSKSNKLYKESCIVSQARTIFKTRNRVCSKNKNLFLKIFKIIILSGRIQLYQIDIDIDIEQIKLHTFWVKRMQFNQVENFWIDIDFDMKEIKLRTFWEQK